MKYKIVEIDPRDAYYVSRDAIVGALVELQEVFNQFEVGDSGWATGVLHYVGRKTIKYEFAGGYVEYKKGDTFLFFRVRLQKTK